MTKTKRLTYGLSKSPHHRCPVCRASCMFKDDSKNNESTPLIPPISTTTRNTTSNTSQGYTPCHDTTAHHYQDLRRHRYMSVQRRYRDLVTSTQIDAWMLSSQSSSAFRAEREWHAAYERAERARRIASSNRSSNNSSSSSSSFGGGSSFGGSGSGGGW